MTALHTKSEQNRRFYLGFISLIVSSISFLVLIGWIYQVGVFTHFLPMWAPMKPNSAFSFILSGFSLWVFYSYHHKFLITLAYLSAFIVFLIGLLTSMEYIFHLSGSIDNFLLIQSDTPLRMSHIAAINFLGIGVALLLSHAKKFSTFIVFLNSIILINSLFTFLCSIYGATSIFNIAPHTAFSFVLLTLGIIIYHAHHPFIQYLLGSTPGSVLGRRLMLPIVFLLPCVGLLILEGNLNNWYGVEFSIALMVIAAISIFFGMLWLNILFVYQAENKTQELVSIIESSSDAIISLTLDGVIKSWNKGAEAMYGFTLAEILGKSITMIAPLDRKKETAGIIEKIKNGLPFLELETIRLHKNGTLIPVSINISPVKSTTGDIIGISGITRNISERKRIDKMKNEFISIVSHELRTPLTSIQGSLSLLLGGIGGDLSPKSRQLLQIAKQNSERLIRLINDILDIQKIESGKIEFHMEPVRIPQILEEAVTANQSYGDYYGITKIKLLDPLPEVAVYADHDRLLQVLTNLISNAIKYSPEGEIVILRAKQDKNEVIISVQDKGPGIPPEFQGKLFQKFAQADSSVTRERGGTGLGLNISRAIVEKIGGNIDFVTKINEGTTFFIKLPIIKQVDKIVLISPMILIYENNKEDAIFLRTSFEKNNFNVILVENDQEAEQALLHKHIDALVLNITQSSAQHFLNEMSAMLKLKHYPLILLANDVTIAEKQLKNLSLPVIDWIQKPFDKNRMKQVIESLKNRITLYQPKILYIENDESLIEVIKSTLQNDAKVMAVLTRKDAEEILRKVHFDLVITDLALPDGSAETLLPLLHELGIPVIIFSAYEVSKNYTRYANHVIIKSKNSHLDLLKMIRQIFKEKIEAKQNDHETIE